MSHKNYIQTLEDTAFLSRPAISSAIQTLSLPKNSKVLDVPCGIGNHMSWMLNQHPGISITGMDIIKEHTEYAHNKLSEKGQSSSTDFVVGDINKLDFDKHMFDLIWCCDGLWLGSPNSGCITSDPTKIIHDMIRMTKPGGQIALLYWSGHKLLPGYPYIESALNTTIQANWPCQPNSNPNLHHSYMPEWLHKAGLKNITSKTFAADIQSPLSQPAIEGIHALLNMFWSQAQSEVSDKVWSIYQDIIDPNSNNYILHKQHYVGYLTYTMYSGFVD